MRVVQQLPVVAPPVQDLEAVVRAARAGDLAAFGELVQRFQVLAYGAAYASLGDYHQAQDAAQVVRLLLERGAAVDVFQAAALGDLPRLRALLDEDPSRARARDEQDRTPLYEAAHNLHLDAVDLLLARGAAVEVTTAWGETALSAAVAHSWDRGGPAAVARLRAAGATLSLRDALCLGEVGRVQELLAAFPERLQERWWDETPLHVAARWGHHDLAAYLLALGHPLTPLDGQGNTPAALAAKWGRPDLSSWLAAQDPQR